MMYLTDQRAAKQRRLGPCTKSNPPWVPGVVFSILKLGLVDLRLTLENGIAPQKPYLVSVYVIV